MQTDLHRIEKKMKNREKLGAGLKRTENNDSTWKEQQKLLKIKYSNEGPHSSPLYIYNMPT